MFTLSHTSHMHARPVFKGGAESQGGNPDIQTTTPKTSVDAQKQGFSISRVPDDQKVIIDTTIGGKIAPYLDSQGRQGVKITLPPHATAVGGDFLKNERNPVSGVIEIDGDTASLTINKPWTSNGFDIIRIMSKDSSGKIDYADVSIPSKINPPNSLATQIAQPNQQVQSQKPISQLQLSPFEQMPSSNFIQNLDKLALNYASLSPTKQQEIQQFFHVKVESGFFRKFQKALPQIDGSWILEYKRGLADPEIQKAEKAYRDTAYDPKANSQQKMNKAGELRHIQEEVMHKKITPQTFMNGQ